jgi:hypothetical protein
MATYATPDDLAPYVSTVPSNATALLTRAQRLVDEALAVAVYEVDDTGMPTDADQVAALKAATCEQVAAWLASGLDDGMSTGVTSVSLGGVSLTRPATGTGADPASRLAPQAWLALRDGRFWRAGPWY